MKAIPRSLGAQLVVLMLGGFVVGTLFAALGMWSQAGILHPIAREHALSRTDTAYRLAQHQPATDDSWVTSFNNRVAQLWIDRQPSRSQMDADERSLATDVRQRLSASTVVVHMPCLDAHQLPQVGTWQRVGSSMQCVEIDLALGDGRWLHTRQVLPAQSLWLESWRMLRFSLLIGIPPVLILMYIFVNRILRPTTALTDAAERMSRGERLDPLDVQGPDEIREIALAFNQMHQRITRFVDERTRMLAAISHDLRTPLTALELQAVMLPDSEQRSEILHTLEEIRQMVGETLRFANQNARAEPSEQVDLTVLLEEVCDHHRRLGHDVRVQVPAQLHYRCRPFVLKRAINNLIENSLKHGTHAMVTMADQGHDGVRIEITDDGPGIPETLLERVFEPFFQLDESRHREAGGSVGLGLATARDCIQAHGGMLRLANRPQGGLIAHIELPVAHRPVVAST